MHIIKVKSTPKKDGNDNENDTFDNRSSCHPDNIKSMNTERTKRKTEKQKKQQSLVGFTRISTAGAVAKKKSKKGKNQQFEFTNEKLFKEIV